MKIFRKQHETIESTCTYLWKLLVGQNSQKSEKVIIVSLDRQPRYMFFHMQPCPRSLVMRIENNSDVCLIVQCIVHTSAFDQRTLYMVPQAKQGVVSMFLYHRPLQLYQRFFFIIISEVNFWHMSTNCFSAAIFYVNGKIFEQKNNEDLKLAIASIQSLKGLLVWKT